MTQEYLFVGTEHKTKILKYRPSSEQIDREVIALKGTDCWIISYTVDGENEGSAKLLSSVNSYITNNFAPITLTNDCSAYYNKRLFPHINEFERKLRKLLYLKSVINKDDIASENIKDLEGKDLGEIFELLFTDDVFINTVRGKVKSMTGKFTKKQIATTIDSIDENVNWDHLIGKDAVPTLKERQ